MRHRVSKRHFNRDTKHRKALIMNLVRSLIEHGEIKTTTEKAKEVKRWTDKLVHKAKVGNVAARRNLHTFFGKRDVVNTLVERIAPLFKDRTSGFTTNEVLGKRRGDNTEMTKLSFIVKPEITGTLKAGKAGTFIKGKKDTRTVSKKATQKAVVQSTKSDKSEKTADSTKKATSKATKSETSIASAGKVPKTSKSTSRSAASNKIATRKSTKK